MDEYIQYMFEPVDFNGVYLFRDQLGLQFLW